MMEVGVPITFTTSCLLSPIVNAETDWSVFGIVIFTGVSIWLHPDTKPPVNLMLDSPYFHPGFAAAVHASGRPVSVVVLRDGSGAVSALLPGHRTAG